MIWSRSCSDDCEETWNESASGQAEWELRARRLRVKGRWQGDWKLRARRLKVKGKETGRLPTWIHYVWLYGLSTDVSWCVSWRVLLGNCLTGGLICLMVLALLVVRGPCLHHECKRSLHHGSACISGQSVCPVCKFQLRWRSANLRNRLEAANRGKQNWKLLLPPQLVLPPQMHARLQSIWSAHVLICLRINVLYYMSLSKCLGNNL